MCHRMIVPRVAFCPFAVLRGGYSAVTRKGNGAAGLTADGTSFTCRLK